MGSFMDGANDIALQNDFPKEMFWNDVVKQNPHMYAFVKILERYSDKRMFRCMVYGVCKSADLNTARRELRNKGIKCVPLFTTDEVQEACHEAWINGQGEANI